MANQLSGVAIIICIAFGFTTFVLLFIFGKRQIMRFALKSRRGPHVPIASDAPKYLRKEIDRRLDAVKEVKFEPMLLNDAPNITSSTPEGDAVKYDHYYRMRAVDSLVALESAIVDSGGPSCKRPPGQDIGFHLHRMAKEGGPLHGCETKLISQYVDAYNHARHEPCPVFSKPEYDRFKQLQLAIADCIRVKRASALKKTGALSRSNPKSTSVGINGRTTVRIITPQDSDGDANETSV